MRHSDIVESIRIASSRRYRLNHLLARSCGLQPVLSDLRPGSGQSSNLVGVVVEGLQAVDRHTSLVVRAVSLDLAQRSSIERSFWLDEIVCRRHASV